MKPLLYAPQPPDVAGLSVSEQEQFAQLWAQWAAKMPRNVERSSYMDAKEQLKDLEVSLPPHLVDKLGIVLGWPEKAVYEIANRVVLEGLAIESGDRDPFGLQTILSGSRFWSEFQAATVSAVTHSVVFLSVSNRVTPRGSVEPGLMFHSAMAATGIWDANTRSLTAGLLINAQDNLGSPTMVTLMFQDRTCVVQLGPSGWQVTFVSKNSLGRVPMRRLPYRPTLSRPFGKSKIDRPTMSMTDRGVRAAARLEVHSELFATMKLMLMGAGANTFLDANGDQIPLWSFVMGRLNGIPKDEEGDVPKLETISAQSPEPHIATLREIATEFSGHSGVPLSNLGVSAANPESAQSRQIAREDTVKDAERCQLIFGEELHAAFEDLVALRDGIPYWEAARQMEGLELKWRPANTPTLASLADAGAKQVAAIPGLELTEVGMEMVGLSPGQIQRAQAELRRKQSISVLDKLTGGSNEPVEAAPDEPRAVPQSAE